MKGFSISLIAIILAVATPELRAEQILWSYQTSVTTYFNGEEASHSDIIFAHSIHTGGDNVGLRLPSIPSTSTQGSATVVTPIIPFYDPTDTLASYFFDSHNGYRIDLTLTDQASAASGTLTLTGHFDGGISETTLQISPVFTGATTQSLVLGENEYSVTISPFVSPDYPDGADGSISARVEVTPLAADTPEPSTLALAGLGLAGLTLARWRRWRTRSTRGGVSPLRSLRVRSDTGSPTRQRGCAANSH